MVPRTFDTAANYLLGYNLSISITQAEAKRQKYTERIGRDGDSLLKVINPPQAPP